MKNVIIGCLLVSNLVAGAAVYWLYQQRTKASVSRKVSSAPKPDTNDIRGVISGAIRTRTSQLERCYNQYLATAPGARGSGSIALNWFIDQQGQVGGLEMKSNDFDDQRLSDCVVDQVRNWSFNPHAEGAPIPVLHRFTFQQKTTANLDF